MNVTKFVDPCLEHLILFPTNVDMKAIYSDHNLFYDKYELNEIIGSGPFSVVHRCTRKDSSHQIYAVKIIDLKKFNYSPWMSLTDLEKSIVIFEKLKHPHIVELKETLRNDDFLYMIFEYLEGPDLIQEIIRRASSGYVYSEAVASHYFKQLLEALAFCHGQSIAHNDLKIEDMFLACRGQEAAAPLKLGGFGSAILTNKNQESSSSTTSLTGQSSFTDGNSKANNNNRPPKTQLKLANGTISTGEGHHNSFSNGLSLNSRMYPPHHMCKDNSTLNQELDTLTLETSIASGTAGEVGIADFPAEDSRNRNQRPFPAPETLPPPDPISFSTKTRISSINSLSHQSPTPPNLAKRDIWSGGIILYILLGGNVPFFGTKDMIHSQITKGQFKMKPKQWDKISDTAKALVLNMLKVSPNERISARDALNHPWILQREKFAPKTHLYDTVEELKKFNLRRKLKGSLHSSLSSSRLNNYYGDPSFLEGLIKTKIEEESISYAAVAATALPSPHSHTSSSTTQQQQLQFSRTMNFQDETFTPAAPASTPASRSSPVPLPLNLTSPIRDTFNKNAQITFGNSLPQAPPYGQQLEYNHQYNESDEELAERYSREWNLDSGGSLSGLPNKHNYSEDAPLQLVQLIDDRLRASTRLELIFDATEKLQNVAHFCKENIYSVKKPSPGNEKIDALCKDLLYLLDKPYVRGVFGACDSVAEELAFQNSCEEPSSQLPSPFEHQKYAVEKSYKRNSPILDSPLISTFPAHPNPNLNTHFHYQTTKSNLAPPTIPNITRTDSLKESDNSNYLIPQNRTFIHPPPSSQPNLRERTTSNEMLESSPGLISSPHLKIIDSELMGPNSSPSPETTSSDYRKKSDQDACCNVKVTDTHTKLVTFYKHLQEPMGVTLKINENDKCVIARILYGGLAYRQGVLAFQTGDSIVEINGRNVEQLNIQTLQLLLSQASGRVVLKLKSLHRLAVPTDQDLTTSPFLSSNSLDDSAENRRLTAPTFQRNASLALLTTPPLRHKSSPRLSAIPIVISSSGNETQSQFDQWYPTDPASLHNNPFSDKFDVNKAFPPPRVITGQRFNPHGFCDMYVKACFDYDAKGDDLNPCPQAGLSFSVGDILKINSKHDIDWWQACKVLDISKINSLDNLLAPHPLSPSTEFYSSMKHMMAIDNDNEADYDEDDDRFEPNGSAFTVSSGLIPSPQLQEWKVACENMERKNPPNSQVEPSLNCAWFLFPKRFSHHTAASSSGSQNNNTNSSSTSHHGNSQSDGSASMAIHHKNVNKDKYLAKHNAVFDQLDVVTYEEVCFVQNFRYKTLVLLGAHGVGRRHIKNTLISNHPHLFAYPIPHTTRPPRPDERNGKNYFFVSSVEQMTRDITDNAYLEYGTHEGHLYGTKLSTVQEILATGKMAVLDVEPQALKILRTTLYAPFIVFIAAPSLTEFPDLDGSLERLLVESDYLRQTYRHFFDLTIVNEDIDKTIIVLEKKVFQLLTPSSPQLPKRQPYHQRSVQLNTNHFADPPLSYGTAIQNDLDFENLQNFNGHWVPVNWVF